jgi:hypothetical protein
VSCWFILALLNNDVETAEFRGAVRQIVGPFKSGVRCKTVHVMTV